jgi:transcriptional antiterminator RfaH
MTGWCVIQSRPNQEEKARLNLARQGFEVYLPRYLKRRRHARRTEIVARPLYPRYLFARLDASQPWRVIQSTYGVAALVEFDGRPALLNEPAIEAIRRQEDDDGLVVFSPTKGLAAGDTVRIMDGAFAETLGLVEHITDEQRVTLLLDMLGRKVRVAVDPAAIEKAD